MSRLKSLPGSLVLLAAMAMVSGGCAVTQRQDTPVDYTFEKDPVTGRSFYLYVPSGYDQSRPAPVVVTCHGTPPYDVANHHIREWKYLGEKHGCIIVAPELIGTDGLLGNGPVIGMLNNERYILSILSLLSYRYNVDRANVMITGFSGGGFPTYWVGLRHPDVFSAAVSRNGNFNQGNLEGWYPPAAAEIPIKVYWGSNDPGTIQSQCEAAVRYLKAKGFQVESEELPGAGHERKPEVAMKFFRENWNEPEGTMRPLED